MNFITFNSENTVNTRKGEATIRLNRKGANSISYAACQAFGLKDGDCISFHQDGDNPADWYLSKDSKGFKLRLPSEEAKALVFNCSAIANTILDALGIDENSLAFKMGEIKKVGKVNYYTIITAVKA